MSLSGGRKDNMDLMVRELEALREENALLKGVLNILRADLQIKDDQIEKVGW